MEGKVKRPAKQKTIGHKKFPSGALYRDIITKNSASQGGATLYSQTPAMGPEHHVQEPVAIIGMACRLPGENNSPRALWEFLKRGGIASNDVPANRFNLKGHYDGSCKPGTMRPPGGMFLESVDLADFDAPFFETSRAEAVAMDPNQRQMLEVVYESLENAGISLESLDGASVGCFVGSYAVGMSLLFRTIVALC